LKIIIVVFTLVLIASFDTLLPDFAPTYTQFKEDQVYDICSSTKELEAINGNISSSLSKLIARPFFRVFKINLKKECSFWAQEKLCSSNKCSICECSFEEIPEFWKNHT